MGQKYAKNRPKIGQKWDKNGTILSPKNRPKIGKKWAKNRPKMGPFSLQNPCKT